MRCLLNYVILNFFGCGKVDNYEEELKVMEERYKWRWEMNMMTDLYWSIKTIEKTQEIYQKERIYTSE